MGVLNIQIRRLQTAIAALDVRQPLYVVPTTPMMSFNPSQNLTVSLSAPAALSLPSPVVSPVRVAAQVTDNGWDTEAFFNDFAKEQAAASLMASRAEGEERSSLGGALRARAATPFVELEDDGDEEFQEFQLAAIPASVPSSPVRFASPLFLQSREEGEVSTASTAPLGGARGGDFGAARAPTLSEAFAAPVVASLSPLGATAVPRVFATATSVDLGDVD